MINTAVDKELKWHLALIASRLSLTVVELGIIWDKLTQWVKDKKESKIVRVNSIQTLFDLSNKNIELKRDFDITIKEVEAENIPSINARLRRLKTYFPHVPEGTFGDLIRRNALKTKFVLTSSFSYRFG